MHSKQQLEIQLSAIETFMASEAYQSYLFTKTSELKNVQEQILTMRPTLETLPALNELHGKQEQLFDDIKFFEDSRSLLKSQLVELEQQNSATQTKQQNENSSDVVF
jgi:hypothetical protein